MTYQGMNFVEQTIQRVVILLLIGRRADIVIGHCGDRRREAVRRGDELISHIPRSIPPPLFFCRL